RPNSTLAFESIVVKIHGRWSKSPTSCAGKKDRKDPTHSDAPGWKHGFNLDYSSDNNRPVSTISTGPRSNGISSIRSSSRGRKTLNPNLVGGKRSNLITIKSRT